MSFTDCDHNLFDILDCLNSAQRPHEQFVWPLLIQITAGRIFITFDNGVLVVSPDQPAFSGAVRIE